MSLWEYTCAFTAWAKFHGATGGKSDMSMSIERLRELGVEE
ncbi:hypothetical protein [Rhodobacter sp. 24-YEA-8]|nr:hypothetical protein [Rhodobacter sp. 24-YEA-8]SEB79641.1 hypothetical protein SAMN05519105_1327 [Rhodobacter sp. 24-YEA-8]